MKVFVLGDSRTGTTSVHEYMQRGGLSSIHYFMHQSGVAEPLHTHRTANWKKVKDFIENSGFQAFSDYPIRIFFRELFEDFPKAHFILTVRRDFAAWCKSMVVLLDGAVEDFDLLQAYYICYNEEIRSYCRDLNLNFLELVIEDDAYVNAQRLSAFLGIQYLGPLSWLNRADELVSFRQGVA